MKVKVKREWQLVEETSLEEWVGTRSYTHRLAVPGGWLYRTVVSIVWEGQVNVSTATEFVPNPNGGAR